MKFMALNLAARPAALAAVAGASLVALGGCEWWLGVEYEMFAERYDPATARFEPIDPPALERNLASVIADDQAGVLVIGGIDERGRLLPEVERLDSASERWEPRASWPAPVMARFVRVGHERCAMGGWTAGAARFRRAVWCYDPGADAWRQGADLPREYTSLAPVAIGRKVYLLGGTDEAQGRTYAPLAEAWVWDADADAWSALSPPPDARGLMAAHELAGRIYLVGGYGSADAAGADDGAPETRAMLAYDPASDTWATAPQMPHARALFGSDVVGGELLVFFGLSSGPTVEHFDPVSQTWRAGGEPADDGDPLDAGAYSYVQHDGALYLLTILDGVRKSASTSSGKLWVYDPDAQAWSVQGSRGRKAPQALFRGVSVGPVIYWVGARTEFSLDVDDPSDRDPKPNGAGEPVDARPAPTTPAAARARADRPLALVPGPAAG